MTYQSVLEMAVAKKAQSTDRSSEGRDAEALAWLAQRLRFEAWLERVREQPGPRPRSGHAAAA